MSTNIAPLEQHCTLFSYIVYVDFLSYILMIKV